MSVRRVRTTGAVAVAAAAAALLLSLTACSASPGSAKPQESAPLEAASDTAAEDWAVKYTECMAEAGFEVEMGSGSGVIKAEAPVDEGGSESSPTVGTEGLDAADKACVEKLGDPPVVDSDAPQVDQADFDAMFLKLSQCLRDAGYDVADPTDTGLTIDEEILPADYEKCQEEAGLTEFSEKVAP